MAAHKLPSDLIKGFDAAYLLSLIVDTPDWQTALSAGSLLEAMLEAAITVNFHRLLSKTDKEEIFSGYGPLATFSGKIALAHAMALISKESRHDLQQIKAIRNDAAHRTNGFQFCVMEIETRCNKLILTDLWTADSLWSAESNDNAVPLAVGSRVLQTEALQAATPRAKFLRSFVRVIVDVTFNVSGALIQKLATFYISKADAAELIAKKFPIPKDYQEALLRLAQLLASQDKLRLPYPRR